MLLLDRSLRRAVCYLLFFCVNVPNVGAQRFNAEGAVCLPTVPFFSGCRTAQTQQDCDTECASPIFDEGCFNAAGLFVSPQCVCSNPQNSVGAVQDIEVALGIDIDDAFVATCGYQGSPPPLNPTISVVDATRFFSAILPQDQVNLLVTVLNSNGDGIIDRNEAALNKNSSGLETAFGCNFWGVDNLLAHIGLYIPNGAVDRYQGSLNPDILTNLQAISRTFSNRNTALEIIPPENNALAQPNAALITPPANTESVLVQPSTSQLEVIQPNTSAPAIGQPNEVQPNNSSTQVPDLNQLNLAEIAACNADALSAACAAARAASNAAREALGIQ